MFLAPHPPLNLAGALFAHTDKNVREEAKALVNELHRWVGKAISNSLKDIKPVQVPTWCYYSTEHTHIFMSYHVIKIEFLLLTIVCGRLVSNIRM